ncbi:glycosyltransferase family 4 protein [Thiohalobacter sp.]|uniref:glycosyltransferase family 4 protein n=1 Tax=Thiohalobacter sp. TaxID=2025948 RepID=UPI00263197E6|nr:glycosyltransferase family 1 protein [Thiohalobacter sp.]
MSDSKILEIAGRPLRIGVDARALCRPTDGIGRYLREILRHVAKIQHEWILYTPTRTDAIIDLPNVTIKGAHRRGMNRVVQQVWVQSVLPVCAFRDNVDVFWGPSHRLPIGLPRSIATVVTIHDLVWRHAPETMARFAHTMERLLMPAAIRRADRILAVSSHTAKDIGTEYPSASGKLMVTPLAATVVGDCGEDVNHSRPFGHRYALFVGTLEPRKNLRRLIQAFSLIQPRLHFPMKLVIAGAKGWGGVELEGMIKKLGLEGEIVLMGRVDDSKLFSLYRHAEMLIMPSLYEGFGLPAVEAMNAGTPVIGSNLASLPEVIGRGGLYVNPFSVESIADRILELANDERLRAALAKAAKDQARRFSWDRTGMLTLRAINSAWMTRRGLKVQARGIGEKDGYR